jgi:hypothetical protein
MLSQKVTAAPLDGDVQHRCVDATRAGCVDPDAERGVVDRRVLGQPQQAVLLALCADCWSWSRDEFVDARLTIAPPPWSSMWRISNFCRGRSTQLTALMRSNVSSSTLATGTRSSSIASPVDRAVQAAERLDGADHERFDRGGVGDVGGEEERFTAGVVDAPHGFVAALHR